MPASNFSIVSGTDGITKVPISTANDVNGYTVVGHLVMAAVAGLATPVDATHPLPVAAAALPLPAGAATDASLSSLATVLGKISTTVSAPPLPLGAATDASLSSLATVLGKINTAITALQASEAPYQGIVAMTVDQVQPAQRAIRINCTTAGTVSLTYADGSKDIVPVAVGLSYIAGAFTTVNGAGTSATATYANMR